MKANFKFILSLLELIALSGTVFIFALLYAFATPFCLNTKTEVIKLHVSHDFDLGYIDEGLLRYLGGAQNGAIEPFCASRGDLIYKIAKTKDWRITLIPGETLEIFFQALSNEYNLSVNKLKMAYYAKTDIPDGTLRPETYFIKRDSNEDGIIERLWNFSVKENDRLCKTLLQDCNKSYWYGFILPKASIIQKEATSVSEMPLISSVIDNRLKLNMPLQMDGSLNYGIYSHQKVTPLRIRSDVSSYNTYKYRGVPPYPVCSVSIDAIKAAINPATTDYLYFVKNANKTHTFNKNYDAHINEIQNVKKSNTSQ